MCVILCKLSQPLASLLRLFHLFAVFASSYSPFLSFTLMDRWNTPLGELSKYICVAKTEHHPFSLPHSVFFGPCV